MEAILAASLRWSFAKREGCMRKQGFLTAFQGEYIDVIRETARRRQQ
jgi:hypothetical protein